MDANVIDGNFLISGIIFFSLILLVIENEDYFKHNKKN